MLLDIGQIDRVTLHKKLDCRPNDQERRNVDREYLKGFHGNSSAISDQNTTTIFGARWIKYGPGADRVPLRVKGGCDRQADGTTVYPQLRKYFVRSSTYASCHKPTLSPFDRLHRGLI